MPQAPTAYKRSKNKYSSQIAKGGNSNLQKPNTS